MSELLRVGDVLYSATVEWGNKVAVQSATVEKVTRAQVKIARESGSGQAFRYKNTLTLEQANGYGRTRHDALLRLGGELAASIARANDEILRLRTLMAECDRQLQEGQ